MLEEGKITAEQAAKMLEYCSSEPTRTYTTTTSTDDSSEVAPEESVEATAELGTALAKLAQDVDLAKLIKGLMRGGISFGFGGGYKVEKVVTGEFGDSPAVVDLQGRHGTVKIVAWDGKGYKAELEARVKAISEEKAEELLQEGLSVEQAPDKLAIAITDPDKVTSLSAKLYVPRRLLSSIQAKTSHGKVILSDLLVEQLSVTTSHGSIDCSQIRTDAGNIELQTSHGSVSLQSVNAASLGVRTSHASIRLDEVTADSITLTTSHGSIKGNCSAGSIKAQTSYASINLHLSKVVPGDINLRTRHGSIRLSGDVPEDIGVSFTGKTSHGGVKVTNSCMKLVRSHGKGDVYYTSDNFDTVEKRLSITAETRHASIYFE